MLGCCTKFKPKEQKLDWYNSRMRFP